MKHETFPGSGDLPDEPTPPVVDPELEKALALVEFTVAKAGEQYIVEHWSPVHADLVQRVRVHIRERGWGRLWFDRRRRWPTVVIGSYFYWTNQLDYPEWPQRARQWDPEAKSFKALRSCGPLVLNRAPLPWPDVR
jgi:hypothetical protein